MDEVFKALADPSRRKLLDALFVRDGQTTAELESVLKEEMSRFGVMKHLDVLEASSLIVTKKVGRFKYHYLNTVPVQEISDRWISRYTAPFARSMADLKQQLERTLPMTHAKPMHVYVTVIKTTPQKLWQALTDPAVTPLYYYGGSVQTTLKRGEKFSYVAPDQSRMVEGEIIEAIENKKLVTTFKGYWDPAMGDDAPSRVTYDIEQQGEFCRLTLTHDNFDGDTATYKIVGGGWPGILSGLKTLLETGQPLGYNPMAA